MSNDSSTSNRPAENNRATPPPNRELAALCVALGLVCMVFPFLGSWIAPGRFPQNLYLLSFCMAFGLFLTAVGGWVSGKWRGWTLGGAAATVVLLFTLLGASSGSPPPEKRMVANVAAPELYGTISAVEVVEDEGRRLYVAPNRALKHANVLIEKANLGGTCLGFIFAPQPSGAGDISEPISVRVPTAFFREIINGAVETPHHERVFYHHATQSLLRNDPGEGDPMPLNGPGICAATVAMPLRAERRHIGFLGLISTAFAAELSDEELISLLSSPDALARRDAREQIAARGPSIVPALMAAIPEDRSHPEHYRYALGAVVALAKMPDAGYSSEMIRSALSDEDIAQLVELVGHRNETMRRWATTAVVALEDERTITPLLNLLAGDAASDSKYSAALALRETAPNYDESVQRDLADATVSLKTALSLRTSRLLEQLSAADGQMPKSGWVFVGASYGKGWAERYFAWPDDDASTPPSVGAQVEAVQSVDLHDGPASFSLDKGWNDPDIVGRLEKGQTVTVRSVQEVASGIFWAEVELRS